MTLLSGWRVDSRRFLPCAFLISVGCGGSGNVEKTVAAAYENLRAISTAYYQATNKLGYPPRSRDDLLPFLREQGDPASLLVSPNDGEEYVIHWNVDYRKIKTIRAPVFAYERTGKGGVRYVLQFRDVAAMTEEEFRSAAFPPGERRPE